jgi:ribosome-associated protein
MADRVKNMKSEEDLRPQQSMNTTDKAMLCAREASQFKAIDLVLLDVRGLTSFTDYFLICSGKSSRQVQGIADNLEASLASLGIKPLGVEGRPEGHWVLMDYADVVIHVFYEPVRYFYDLESLWSDAARVIWSADAALPGNEVEQGSL